MKKYEAIPAAAVRSLPAMTWEHKIRLLRAVLCCAGVKD